VPKLRREEVERTRERGEGRKNRGRKDYHFKFKLNLKLHCVKDGSRDVERRSNGKHSCSESSPVLK
jgi:hypothetical protein